MSKRGGRTGLVAAGVLGLGLVAWAGFTISAQHQAHHYNLQAVTLAGQAYHLEIADTPAKQQLGLGQRNSLPANQGMLFTYDTPQQLCFWMKDMRFPLDIIWLDANKRIQYVAANVAPDSYPTNYCQASAQYVLELNAGDVGRLGLKRGQQLGI